MRLFPTCLAVLAVSACADGPENAAPPADPETDDATATRPVGEPRLVTVEGRVEAGTECDTVRTPDGKVWSVNFGEADFGSGDYIRLTGEIADASFCMEGEGTLIPQRIDAIEPPARDRDPARAGGVALTREYVVGSWVARGVNADCDDPDFRIRTTSGGTVLNGEIGNHDNSALVILDQYPRLDLDEPMDDLPLEARGPDGLAILRPATDAAYDPVTIGSATITGDGVVFVKCA
ncbi:DUF5818 domain-containing protein [Aurantiacibacter sp. MUD61]|uniref:DUF5818 domain-containing protein n=1 Tax=Aurantiacibacter sp. MUD61 TaxID=3009083 RepID=UPI0022F047BF|nr:DUF5818 domain-containing protein [Aurantiacibacter sp. MUD61]